MICLFHGTVSQWGGGCGVYVFQNRNIFEILKIAVGCKFLTAFFTIVNSN